jgi:hypothetical protein
MKACSSKRKSIALLALGEVDEREVQGLRSHVQSCAGCRQYLEEVSGLAGRLDAADRKPVLEPSPFFHRNWVGRLKAQPSVSLWQMLTERLSWRMVLPALGAAAALLILTFSLLPRQPAASQTVPITRAEATSMTPVRDLSPSVANYQRVATRSLDEFDDLLTAQASRTRSATPRYTASSFAMANLPN